MAHTKRKRRSKHRGTAAGTIEARGRTGRKPTEQERRKGDREGRLEERRFQRPTPTRAGLAAVLLFVLFQVGLAGHKQGIVTSLALALLAFLIYVPLGYQVDRILWSAAY